jgi:exonuclease I
VPAAISINRAPVLTPWAAVVALLADRLGIDPSSIAVVSGHGSPAKVVAVDSMDDEAIRAAFSPEKPGKRGGMRNRE